MGLLKERIQRELFLILLKTFTVLLTTASKLQAFLIDFRIAFDLVNHDILLKKLELLEVRGNALNWFALYLRSCQQKVKVSNVLSESKPFNIGVGLPQCSVLSATLFLILTNNLLPSPLNGKIIPHCHPLFRGEMGKYLV